MRLTGLRLATPITAWRHVWRCLRVFLAVVCLGSPPAVAELRVLTLDDSSDGLMVGTFMDLLEDRSGQLEFDQVRHPSHAANFLPHLHSIANLGFTRSTFWIRLTLRNGTTDREDWALAIADGMLQRVDFYHQTADGSWQRQQAGSLVALSERADQAITPLFRLRLAPGTATTVYLRVKTEYASVVPLSVHSLPNLSNMKQARSLMHGLFIGTSLSLAIYNLFVFLTLREKVNLLYVFFIGSSVLNTLLHNGLLFATPLGEYPAVCNLVFMLTYAGVIMATAVFSRDFLSPDSRWLIWNMRLMAIACLIGAGLFLAGNITAWASMTTAMGLFGAFYVLSFAIGRVAERHVPSIFFTLGFGSYLTGQTLFILSLFDVLNSNPITQNAVEAGSIIHAVMMSLALSARHRELKLENEGARHEMMTKREFAVNTVKRYKEKLETDVRERTQDLVLAQQTMASHEKLSALGTLTAGVAHEINNPNNFIQASVQNAIAILRTLEERLLALMDDAADDAAGQRIQTYVKQLDGGHRRLLGHSKRIDASVKGLREITQLDQNAGQVAYEIGNGIRELLRIFASKYGSDIDFLSGSDPRVRVMCQPAQFNHALLNLLLNSVQAIEVRRRQEPSLTGRIDVRLEVEAETDMPVCITLQDNGIGMDEDTLQRAQEPFFTTKKGTGGTGLGLSMAVDTVRDAGGSLTLGSTYQAGTTVIIRLPQHV